MNANQQAHEEMCARVYLESLGGQVGIEWELQRTEEAFPYLKDHQRGWEFVVHRKNQSEWIALEVKCLLIAEGERQSNDWRKLVGHVNGKLEGRLPGKYWLFGLPKCNFDQEQKRRLEEILSEVVEQIAPTITKDEKPRDIGPEIKSRFAEWPDDRVRQPRIDVVNLTPLYPPHRLLVSKSSDVGSLVGLGGSPVVVYSAGPTLEKAVSDHPENIEKANKQLGKAKKMGASKTVLLLDSHIHFDPHVVAKAIRALNASCLSNIYEVYLLKTFDQRFAQQVWPDEQEESSLSTNASQT